MSVTNFLNSGTGEFVIPVPSLEPKGAKAENGSGDHSDFMWVDILEDVRASLPEIQELRDHYRAVIVRFDELQSAEKQVAGRYSRVTGIIAFSLLAVSLGIFLYILYGQYDIASRAISGLSALFATLLVIRALIGKKRMSPELQQLRRDLDDTREKLALLVERSMEELKVAREAFEADLLSLEKMVKGR